jgi:hypothetical protein
LKLTNEHIDLMFEKQGGWPRIGSKNW